MPLHRITFMPICSTRSSFAASRKPRASSSPFRHCPPPGSAATGRACAAQLPIALSAPVFQCDRNRCLFRIRRWTVSSSGDSQPGLCYHILRQLASLKQLNLSIHINGQTFLQTCACLYLWQNNFLACVREIGLSEQLSKLF